MPLHMILKDGDNLNRIQYNPARDLAYIQREMVEAVVKIYQEGIWPEELDKFMEHYGVTHEDVDLTLKSWIDFLSAAVDDPKGESQREVAVRVGWDEKPWAAKLLVNALLGHATSASLFAARRDICDFNKLDPLPLTEARQSMEDFLRFSAGGAWKRKLYTWRRGVREWVRQRLRAWT